MGTDISATITLDTSFSFSPLIEYISDSEIIILRPRFVTLAEDYVKHDIYMMKIVQRFDRQLIDRFGRKYHKLRDIFNDDEVGK
jgi:hypothetical protein